MTEAASHAASNERLEQAIADFETPRAVALSCLGKNADQIHSLLLRCAEAVAVERGFTKDGSYADMRALRYASEAIEWLWKNADGATLERHRGVVPAPPEPPDQSVLDAMDDVDFGRNRG